MILVIAGDYHCLPVYADDAALAVAVAVAVQ
jgi:hypothetical protein